MSLPCQMDHIYDFALSFFNDEQNPELLEFLLKYEISSCNDFCQYIKKLIENSENAETVKLFIEKLLNKLDEEKNNSYSESKLSLLVLACFKQKNMEVLTLFLESEPVVNSFAKIMKRCEIELSYNSKETLTAFKLNFIILLVKSKNYRLINLFADKMNFPLSVLVNKSMVEAWSTNDFELTKALLQTGVEVDMRPNDDCSFHFPNAREMNVISFDVSFRHVQRTVIAINQEMYEKFCLIEKKEMRFSALFKWINEKKHKRTLEIEPAVNIYFTLLILQKMKQWLPDGHSQLDCINELIEKICSIKYEDEIGVLLNDYASHSDKIRFLKQPEKTEAATSGFFSNQKIKQKSYLVEILRNLSTLFPAPENNNNDSYIINNR